MNTTTNGTTAAQVNERVNGVNNRIDAERETVGRLERHLAMGESIDYDECLEIANYHKKHGGHVPEEVTECLQQGWQFTETLREVTNPIKAADLHTPRVYQLSERRYIVKHCTREQAEELKRMGGRYTIEGVIFRASKGHRHMLHVWQNNQSRKERAEILGDGWKYTDWQAGDRPKVGDEICAVDGTRGIISETMPEGCVIKFRRHDDPDREYSLGAYFIRTEPDATEPVPEATGVDTLRKLATAMIGTTLEWPSGKQYRLASFEKVIKNKVTFWLSEPPYHRGVVVMDIGRTMLEHLQATGEHRTDLGSTIRVNRGAGKPLAYIMYCRGVAQDVFTDWGEAVADLHRHVYDTLQDCCGGKVCKESESRYQVYFKNTGKWEICEVSPVNLNKPQDREAYKEQRVRLGLPAPDPELEITEAEGIKIGDKVRHNWSDEVATVTGIRKGRWDALDGEVWLFTLDYGKDTKGELRTVLGPFQMELNGKEFRREALTLFSPRIIAPVTEADRSLSWETGLTAEEFHKLKPVYGIADEDRDIVGRRFRHAISTDGDWLEVFISDYAGNERHALVYSYEPMFDDVRCKVRSLDFLRQFYTTERGWLAVAV